MVDLVILVWRILWYIPFHVVVAIHIATVFVVYGREHADGLWDEWRMQ